MQNSVVLLLVSVTLAVSAPVKAQQSPPTPEPPPRVALLVPGSAGVPPAAVWEILASALRGRGVVVAPEADVHAAAQGLSLSPADLAAPTPVRELCRALDVAGIVLVSIEQAPPGAAEPFLAHVRVVGPAGDVRLQSTVALRSRRPSSNEARVAAALAVQGLVLPAATVATRDPAGAPNADAGAVPSVPMSAYPEPPIVPPPEPLRMTLLSAAPTITFRDLVLKSPTPSSSDLNYKIAAPYYGVALGAEFFPFSAGWAKYLGFNLEYAFSAARVTTTVTNLTPNSLLASQDRLEADLLGRIPGHPGGGELTLHLGFAFDGFFVSSPPPLVTSIYLGPRFLADYSHPLPFQLAFDLQAGVRPLQVPGSALTSAFGPTQYSFGLEGRAALSGPFAPTMMPNLRWVCGYDFLYYASAFGHPATTQQEAYNRIFLGVSYQL